MRLVPPVGLLGCSSSLAVLLACHAPTSPDPTDEEPTPTDVAPTETAGTSETGALPTTIGATATLRMHERTGLVAWLDVTSDAETTLVVDVAIDGRAWQLTVDAPAAMHTVPLFGLRPDADLVVEVRLEGGDREGRAHAELHVPPVPPEVHIPVTNVVDASRLEPGVTIVANHGHIVGLDTDGVPCWYMRYQQSPVNEIGLVDGQLMVLSNRDHLELVDFLGDRTLRIGTALDPYRQVTTDALALHHDAWVLPNGNFLTFSVERRRLLYPTDEVDPLAPWAEQWVAGDVVVELQRDGVLARQIPLLDVLDPARIGRDGVRSTFWFQFEPWRDEQTRDWDHANSISYDEASDTVLVSARHQDAIVGLSLQTGELKWIVGHPANWGPEFQDKILLPGNRVQNAGWFWHQHSARFLPDGTIALFDNHNYGAPAFQPPGPNENEISRALIISVDPARREWDIEWTWGKPLGLYGRSYGDLDVLPITGNRLVDFGELDPGIPVSSTLFEVTEGGDVLSRSDLTGDSWYRALRVTGVFPGPGR